MEREIGEYVIRPDPDNEHLPYVLGEGSFGITYVAKHRVINLPVALKVLKASAPTPEIIESFAQEARTLRELHHPHIAAFENVGISNGVFYCAMELCEFGDLDSIARLRGALGTGQLLTIASQTAAALGAAHEQGYIHRDVKPSNLILARLKDGTIGVKLIDFGLSVCPRDRPQGGSAGSPVFTSPEQLSMGSVDVRSDLYALGITLWYLAGGRRPGQLEGNAQDVFNAHLATWEFSCEEVPPLLKPLVQKLVRKNPSERFQNAAEVAATLDALSAQFENAPEELDLSLVATPLRGESEHLHDLVPREPKPLEQTYFLQEGTGRDNGVGTIYRATTLPTPGQTVGVTIVHRGDKLKGDSLLELRRQVTQHRHLAGEVDYPVAFVRPLQFHVFPGNQVAIASDWVDGPAFEDILRMRRRFSFEELLPMLLQMGEGIDFCHDHGLPIPELSERAMTVVSAGAGSWAADENWDTVLSDLKIRFLPLNVQSGAEPAESDIPEATIMQTLVDAGGSASEAATNPTALFASKIYRYVCGAPVSRMAFTNPGAYTAIPGLGSDANRLLAGFIAQRQPAIAGCVGILEAICDAEAITLPAAGKEVSTSSADFTPAAPREPWRSQPAPRARTKPPVDDEHEEGRHQRAGKFLLPLAFTLLVAGGLIGMNQLGLLGRLLYTVGVYEPPITATAPDAGEATVPPEPVPPVPSSLELSPPPPSTPPQIAPPSETASKDPISNPGEERFRPRLLPIGAPGTPAQISASPRSQNPETAPPTAGTGSAAPLDQTWEAGRRGWIFHFEGGRWVTASPVLSRDSASNRRSLCRLLSDADQLRGVIYQGWFYQPLPDGRVVLAQAAESEPPPSTPARESADEQASPAPSTEILLISRATQIPVRLQMDRTMMFTEQELLQLSEIRYPQVGVEQRQDGEDLILRFPTGPELRLSRWFLLLQRD